MQDQAAPLPTPTERKKKKDKIRAAWISFIGRILAQFVGAAATIALGLMLLDRHHHASLTASTPAVRQVSTGSTMGKPSIAVLPFQHVSGDTRREHIADGMTASLITELAKRDGLRVISRTSSTSYKGQRKALPQIAQELGASHVLEGSVIHAGDRMRITAQLIDAGTDEHVWASRYDRPLRDVLAVQDDISAAIAQQVERAVTSRQPEVEVVSVARR
jgi:TolB-like protein